MSNETGDAHQRVADRYGTTRTGRRDRRIAWVAASIVVLGGVAFVALSGWQRDQSVSVQDIGFTVSSELEAVMKFEVTAPPKTPVACAVEALNEAKATVGWSIVELPVEDTRTQAVSATVRTVTPIRAVTAKKCWIIE